MSCQLNIVCLIFYIAGKNDGTIQVTLTKEESKQLQAGLGKGKHTSQQSRNACILLNSDESLKGQKLSNEQIAKVLHINTKAVASVKQSFVEEGFDRCNDRKPYSKKVTKKADGDFEAPFPCQENQVMMQEKIMNTKGKVWRIF